MTDEWSVAMQEVILMYICFLLMILFLALGDTSITQFFVEAFFVLIEYKGLTVAHSVSSKRFLFVAFKLLTKFALSTTRSSPCSSYIMFGTAANLTLGFRNEGSRKEQLSGRPPSRLRTLVAPSSSAIWRIIAPLFAIRQFVTLMLFFAGFIALQMSFF